MAFKLVILAALLAVARAGYLGGHAAAVGYAAPAIAAHAVAVPAAITTQHSNTLRSFGNLAQVSTSSGTIDTAYSSSRSSDIRVSHDAVAAAPAIATAPAAFGYAAHAVAAPVLAAPAAFGYAAHAVAAPAAVVTQQSNIFRSHGNLGQVSTSSNSIDTAYSSSRNADIRVSNDAIAVSAAPAAIGYAAPAVAAPATIGYAAPATVGYAAPAAVGYAAPAVSAPAAIGYAAPAAVGYAAHAVAAPAAVGYAAPATVGYGAHAVAAAPAIAYGAGPAHVSFHGIGAKYAW